MKFLLNRYGMHRWFWVGLLLIGLYWWSVHTIGFSRGYSEDFCFDVPRQLMAEALDQHGAPTFHTNSVMTPFGASLPFMSWSIERDWIGAYFWKWDSNIPYPWILYGVSLLLSFIGVGFILRKMEFDRRSAWIFAAIAVLVNIPRHFKTWHHFEHLPQHWIYLSFFLDAWIWKNFTHENKVRIERELWRGVLLLATLTSTGYFWGGLVLEWLVFRVAMLIFIKNTISQGRKISWSIEKKQLIFPVILGVLLLLVELRWLVPLAQEAQVSGQVYNGVGFFSNRLHALRPIWLDYFLPVPEKIHSVSETVCTQGWLFWIPLIFCIYSIRKKMIGPGVLRILPFVIFLILTLLWQYHLVTAAVIELIQKGVPFLSFFRVASRWNLFYPSFLFSLLAFCWPWVVSQFQRLRRQSRVFRFGVILFILSTAAELLWLLHPVNMMPEMPQSVSQMLNEIRQSPGEMVLNLPFCVAGGNGVCTAEQCPQYPTASMTQCLRMWHQKKIFGVYQARMNEGHCDIYRRSPYQSWFSAWREQRCFTPYEWEMFCQETKSLNLAAILVHPDAWVGSDLAECRAEFERRLGPPHREVRIPTHSSFGGVDLRDERILYFGGKCIR